MLTDKESRIATAIEALAPYRFGPMHSYWMQRWLKIFMTPLALTEARESSVSFTSASKIWGINVTFRNDGAGWHVRLTADRLDLTVEELEHIAKIRVLVDNLRAALNMS